MDIEEYKVRYLAEENEQPVKFDKMRTLIVSTVQKWERLGSYHVLKAEN